MYEIRKLRARTKRYKKLHSYSVRVLAEKIGVGESWLRDFLKSTHKEPKQSKLRKVHDHLMRHDK